VIPPVVAVRADIEQIRDVVARAYRHHHARDIAESHMRMDREPTLSPLTTELGQAFDRLNDLLTADPARTGAGR
jgi:hypothetical protein